MIGGVRPLRRLGLRFYTDDEKRNLSAVQITQHAIYNRGKTRIGGLMDPRMGGGSDRLLPCATCRKVRCDGHFGHIELESPVYLLEHQWLIRSLAQTHCRVCSRERYTVSDEALALHGPSVHGGQGLVDARPLLEDKPNPKKRLEALVKACKLKHTCVWCGAVQPTYKTGKGEDKLRIMHIYRPKDLAAMAPEERDWAAKPITPAEMQSMIKHIPWSALRIIGFRPHISHPMWTITSVFLVMPPTARPPLRMAEGSGSRSEDDVTLNIQEIIKANQDLAASKARLADRTTVATAIRSLEASIEQEGGLLLAHQAERSELERLQAKLHVLETTAAGAAINLEKDTHDAFLKLQSMVGAYYSQNWLKALPQMKGAVDTSLMRGASKRQRADMRKRIQGKQGRFRGNMTGKRVDFSGRCVCGGDSFKNIWWVGIPATVMDEETFPERVTSLNMSKLQAKVRRGGHHPDGGGALYIKQPSITGEVIKVLRGRSPEELEALAESLRIGDIVERQFVDGDVIIVNRQPTLREHSMMAAFAYRHHTSQLIMPLAIMGPFNADNDGDEINCHFLQTLEAVAEAVELLLVPHHIVSSQAGSAIIGAVQDACIGAHTMTAKDVFFTKDQVCQLAMCIQFAAKAPGWDASDVLWEPVYDQFLDWLGGLTPHDKCEGELIGVSGGAGAGGRSKSKTLQRCSSGQLFAHASVERFLPAPAILKSPRGALWTGRQVMEWLLPAQLNYVRGAAILPDGCVSTEDVMADKGVVVIRGMFVAGQLNKSTVGPVSGGLVHEIFRLADGPGSAWAAARFVSDLQRVAGQWMVWASPCISITDCFISPEAEEEVCDILGKAVAAADAVSALDAPHEDKENRIHDIFGDARNAAARVVLASASSDKTSSNAIKTVADSGAKGSADNIAQMGAFLGQTTVSGKRPQPKTTRWGRRTLPCHAFNAPLPETQGLISSNYAMGLTPEEQWEAFKAGRESIVNIAAATCQTGYGQRRMIKGMESQTVSYTGEVRVGSNSVVQWRFGGHGYTPKLTVPVKLTSFLEESEEAVLAAVAADESEASGLRSALRVLRQYRRPGVDEVRLPIDFCKELRKLSPIHPDERTQQRHDELCEVLPLCVETLQRAMMASHRTDIQPADWHEAHGIIDIETPTPKPPHHLWLVGKPPVPGWADSSWLARHVLTLQLTAKAVVESSITDAAMLQGLVARWACQYERTLVQPAEAVGAKGATFIGEPGTQTSLNFHRSAGNRSANVSVMGLPRMLQLMGANDTRGTANMVIYVEGDTTSEQQATAERIARDIKQLYLWQLVGSVDMHEEDDLNIGMEEGQTVSGSSSSQQQQSLADITRLADELEWTTRASVTHAWGAALHSKGLVGDIRRRAAVSAKVQLQLGTGKPVEGSPCMERLAGCKRLRLGIRAPAAVEAGMTLAQLCLTLRELLGCAAVIHSSEAWEREWYVTIQPVHISWWLGLDEAQWAAVPSVTKALAADVVLGAMHDSLKRNGRLRGLDDVTDSSTCQVVTRHVDDWGNAASRQEWIVETLGSNLMGVLRVPGVDASRTSTNNVQEMADVLGVEMGVWTLASELHKVVVSGTAIDFAHCGLLAETQGLSGEVVPLNRNHMEVLGNSLLQRATFEKPLAVVGEGAAFAQSDPLGGATERMILGLPVSAGTGLVELVDDRPTTPTNGGSGSTEADGGMRTVLPVGLYEQVKSELACGQECMGNSLRTVLPVAAAQRLGRTLDDEAAEGRMMQVMDVRMAARMDTGDLEGAGGSGMEWSADVVGGVAERAEKERDGDTDVDMQGMTATSSIHHAQQPWGPFLDMLLKLRRSLQEYAPLQLEVRWRLAHNRSTFEDVREALWQWPNWTATPASETSWSQRTDAWYMVRSGVGGLSSGADVAAGETTAGASAATAATALPLVEVRTLLEEDEVQAAVRRRTHINKRVRHQADVPLQGTKLVATLSAETEVPPAALPVRVDPHRVRIKQRQTFRQGPLAVVLTRFWEAPNITEAEALQLQAGSGRATRFEVEVEVADAWLFLHRDCNPRTWWGCGPVELGDPEPLHRQPREVVAAWALWRICGALTSL